MTGKIANLTQGTADPRDDRPSGRKAHSQPIAVAGRRLALLSQPCAFRQRGVQTPHFLRNASAVMQSDSESISPDQIKFPG